MKKMTIYYGSTTGTCETLAASIAQALGMSNDNVHNVTEMTKEDLENNDVLILGSSTWGCGDLQDDWYDGVEILKKADLTGKKVALFACGDGESYGDTFCEAMTHIHDAAVPSLGKSQLPTTRLLLLQPWTVMISSVWHLTT